MAMASGLLVLSGTAFRQQVKATGGFVTNYNDADGASWTVHIFRTVGANSQPRRSRKRNVTGSDLRGRLGCASPWLTEVYNGAA